MGPAKERSPRGGGRLLPQQDRTYFLGQGVPQDYAKAAAYLQKAGNHPEPKEELLHYKKTLFGKWVRR